MKPMIKYRGGKSREIPSFEKYIPTDYDRFFEPFLGGGAVFFYLEPQSAVINDINADVINFYRDVQKHYPKMRKQLDELQALYEANQEAYKELKAKNPDERVENRNEALYYLIRDMFNGKVPKEYLDSVIYYFINKTAYSGMIRYNSAGEYNVPFGRYANFNTNIITKKHSELLKSAEILCGDYTVAFNMATSKDFMFLDPPYDCIFNDYGNLDFAEGFNEDEHRRLAQDFKNLSCKALMVIGRTSLTEELYGSYIRDEYFKSYAVNIRNRFKSDSKHIVVMNYKEEG
jgi:DNA adenine methylase